MATPSRRRTARSARAVVAILAVTTALAVAPTAVAHAAPETREWVGPDSGLWSVAENWSPAGVPVAGDSVIIDDWSINDVGPLTLESIELRGGRIQGEHAITATRVSTTANSGESYLFAPANLAATTEFAVAIGSSISLQGGVVGSGTLLKTGPSALRLTAAGTTTGDLRIAAGSIQVEHASALGSASSVEVEPGASLTIADDFTIPAALQLGGGAALDAPKGATISGPVVLGGDTSVNVGQGRLAFTGTFDAAGHRLTKRGEGTLEIADQTIGGAGILVELGALDLAGRSLDTPVSLAENGTLTGSGTIPALGNSEGDVELSPPGLTITSTTTLGSDLEVALAGNGKGVDHGVLRVEGALHIAGTAELLPTMAYDAPVGTVFTVVEATGGITGTFAQLPEGAFVPNVSGEELRVSYLNGAVTLTVYERSLTLLQLSSTNPAVGETVTLTATVRIVGSATAPSGDVTFLRTGTQIGSATLVDGVATITTTFPSAGTYMVQVGYSGSPTVAPSGSMATQVTVGMPVASITGPPTAEGHVGQPFEYRPTIVGNMGGPLAVRGVPPWATFDRTTGAITGTPDTEGEWVVQITPPIIFIDDLLVKITVSSVELAELKVTPSATTVRQGDAVTLDVVGIDDLGREIPLPADEFVVTSSVPSDIVDGLRVIFPTASPHTLTVRHEPSGLEGSVTVEVTPASPGGGGGTGEPASSGGSGGLAASGATTDGGLVAVLLLFGGAALLARRRRAA